MIPCGRRHNTPIDGVAKRSKMYSYDIRICTCYICCKRNVPSQRHHLLYGSLSPSRRCRWCPLSKWAKVQLAAQREAGYRQWLRGRNYASIRRGDCRLERRRVIRGKPSERYGRGQSRGTTAGAGTGAGAGTRPSARAARARALVAAAPNSSTTGGLGRSSRGRGWQHQCGA